MDQYCNESVMIKCLYRSYSRGTHKVLKIFIVPQKQWTKFIDTVKTMRIPVNDNVYFTAINLI